MEDSKRNGMIPQDNTISKRDKKRSNIATRLNKLELTFKNDRDIFYRNSLHELQNKLASLQQGSNEEYITKKIDLEEVRDYELTKLRLWEEYQVKRIESEYKLDLEKAKDNHDKMIKLIKEKLYDKLQKQIKNLKEDKYLLNLLNSNSHNQDNDDENQIKDDETLAVAMGLNLQDRRSLRKRGEYFGRFATGEMDDLSDGGGNLSSNQNGYTSSGKRRRLYTTRYSSNDEVSSSAASAKPWHSGVPGSKNLHGHAHIRHGGVTSSGIGSGYESNLSDKDYDALNTLIMENDDGGKSLIYDGNGLNGGETNGSGIGQHNYKVQTRGSHKQFVGPQGLRVEELNEDLELLRSAIKKE
ncbi:SDS3 [Candida pseudojiufengensis]|uniref:SDS3 n=1 Tax=Candida pseudojiufengensis TaxID=497109 RepID=UPI002225B3AF|nr:SDS3 [Candida pseudojiufengensis]KAI5962335.1 SDS3 [Candida pseudojiufengensis]